KPLASLGDNDHGTFSAPDVTQDKKRLGARVQEVPRSPELVHCLRSALLEPGSFDPVPGVLCGSHDYDIPDSTFPKKSHGSVKNGLSAEIGHKVGGDAEMVLPLGLASPAADDVSTHHHPVLSLQRIDPALPERRVGPPVRWLGRRLPSMRLLMSDAPCRCGTTPRDPPSLHGILPYAKTLRDQELGKPPLGCLRRT